LEACPYKPGSKRRVPKASKVHKLVKQHLKLLKKKEREGVDQEEEEEEQQQGDEPTFFRRGAKSLKAKAKGVGKKAKAGKQKGVSTKGTAVGKKSRDGHRPSAVSAGLNSDLARMSVGGAASVASVGRRSLGNASCADQCEDGAGAVRVSSRSTVAGGADKDNNSEFDFNFQSIMEGQLDRNALNGAIVLQPFDYPKLKPCMFPHRPPCQQSAFNIFWGLALPSRRQARRLHLERSLAPSSELPTEIQLAMPCFRYLIVLPTFF
jgi:hypothetical protein